MFARYSIDSITNGVHAGTWTSPPFKALFDRHIPGWPEDNFSLRYAISIPREEIWAAHRAAKASLLEEVERWTGERLDPDTFTLGFARRATAYKRPTLLFRNLGALEKLAETHGGLQMIFAGKAHPMDEEGKAAIRALHHIRKALHPGLRLVYLENYGMEAGRLMTAGTDLWLNTPLAPLEASGTSGMKAALNGVPSLSVLDGWWLEGHIEGITGWAIGNARDGGTAAKAGDDDEDSDSIYAKLGEAILPLFRGNRSGWIDLMRHAIALNGSFFNTQRMVQQYVVNAYF
jgi:starch phosphorylase